MLPPPVSCLPAWRDHRYSACLSSTATVACCHEASSVVIIYDLVIDPDRIDHIARHGVTVEEVDDVVFGRPLILRTREDRYLLIGQTVSGRYLTVVVAPRGHSVYGLVTARDAEGLERRRYQDIRGR